MIFSPSTVQCSWHSPLGPMIVAASESGLVGVWFSDQRHLPDTSAWPVATMTAAEAPASARVPWLQQACAQLADYFAGLRTQFDLPLDLSGGTAFQQAVWRALLSIPYGHTTHYGALARAIGKPQAVRALGAAVGRNPLSLIVPCHRVLGANGALTGYAGGLDRKRALLGLEGAARVGVPVVDYDAATLAAEVTLGMAWVVTPLGSTPIASTPIGP